LIIFAYLKSLFLLVSLFSRIISCQSAACRL
jgi:hypothetical protein